MRRAAMILVAGGALIALGLYLFPMYYGQELFVNWTTGLAGGEETLGVIWAGILAGAIIVAGIALLRPSILNIFGNPLYFAGAVVVAVLAVTILLNAGGA